MRRKDRQKYVLEKNSYSHGWTDTRVECIVNVNQKDSHKASG
jgi:hypothetical protein